MKFNFERPKNVKEEIPKPKEVSPLDQLKTGEDQQKEIQDVINGTRNVATLDLFKWNTGPEEAVQILQAQGLVVEIAPEEDYGNANHTGRILIAKDENTLDQLKLLKRDDPDYYEKFLELESATA